MWVGKNLLSLNKLNVNVINVVSVHIITWVKHTYCSHDYKEKKEEDVHKYIENNKCVNNKNGKDLIINFFNVKLIFIVH